MARAFEILGQVVGTSRAKATGTIWRHIVLSADLAAEIECTMLLPPGPRFDFQSFIRTRRIAEEFGGEDGFADGDTHILVSASVEAADCIPY